jgi:hypothetical protein
MPFAGDLPNNNFAAYEAEMVMWKCKWQNVTEKPSTLINTLKHASSGESLDGHALRTNN